MNMAEKSRVLTYTEREPDALRDLEAACDRPSRCLRIALIFVRTGTRGHG